MKTGPGCVVSVLLVFFLTLLAARIAAEEKSNRRPRAHPFLHAAKMDANSARGHENPFDALRSPAGYPILSRESLTAMWQKESEKLNEPENSGEDRQAVCSASAAEHKRKALPSEMRGQKGASPLMALNGTGAIAGYVYESDGVTPAESIMVWAYHTADGWIDWGCTNPDGSYLVTGLPERDYLVQASGQHCLSWKNICRGEWYDDSDYGNADLVTVSADDTTYGIDFILECDIEYGAISGYVHDSNGTPIEDTWVGAYNRRGSWVSDACTNSDGSYVIRELPVWDYYVNADGTDCLSWELVCTGKWYDDANGLGQAEVVSVTVDDTTSGIDFVLDCRGVSGHIYESDGVTPVEDLAIWLYHDEYGLTDRICSNPDGSYFVSDVHEGENLVWVSGYDCSSHSYVCTSTFGSVWFSDNDFRIDDVDFILDCDIGAISGYVYESDGVTPAESIGIAIYSDVSGWVRGPCTDSDGSYIMVDLPEGDYYVYASGYSCSSDNYVCIDEFYDDAIGWGDADLVTVITGDTTSAIDFILDCNIGYGAVSGYVYRSDGVTPIESTEIEILRLATGYLIDASCTNPDGRYLMDGLLEGNYWIMASGNDCSSANAVCAPEVYDDATGWEDVDLVSVSADDTTFGIDFILQCEDHGVSATVVCGDFSQARVTVSVQIDMSQMFPPDTSLGTFVGSLDWDTSLLSYVDDSGITGGFAGEVNSDSAGHIMFNGFSDTGIGDTVTIFTVVFDVIGAAGSPSTIDLEFTVMTAADTYTDLIPYLTVNDCEFQIPGSGLCGDVNDDVSCNSTDALVVLSYDVGLPVPAAMEDKIDQGCADVNKDGSSNSTDALIILSYDVGFPVPFCVCECGCPCPGEPGAKLLGVKGAKATVGANEYRSVRGETVIVPVVVDVSRTVERLGSFSGSLSWDSQVLNYVGYSGGKTAGFEKPLVNEDEAINGKLTFAGACAEGAAKEVNIINISFEVVGSEDASSPIDVGFEAMTAAHSFSDLLAGLKVVSGQVTVQGLPSSFALEQNYPNPFNPTTTISYTLPVQSEEFRVKEGGGILHSTPFTRHVTLKIFNVLGQEVAGLMDEVKEPGYYTVTWDATGLPSGIYFYRLEARGASRGNRGDFVQTRRMLLLR